CSACMVGVMALIALIQRRRTTGRRSCAVLGMACAAGGIYLASRQLWLQSLPPDQVPACGPTSVSYLMDVLPFWDVMQKMLQGDGNCAEVHKVFGEIGRAHV